MDLWTLEREQWNKGHSLLCGVDEAGAGPLAGPVYAAAVILPREIEIPGLNDSKKLTEKKREILFDEITARAEAWSVAFATAEEIDGLDILNARMLAMQRAIDGLPVKPDICLIDGNRDHGSRVSIETPHVTLIGGDGKSASIAAASILAKVSRDRHVSQELEALYPQYGFAGHKGYGTKAHYAALDQYGPCPVHRRTFLKKWEARRESEKDRR
jgi:ribonuclease HII